MKAILALFIALACFSAVKCDYDYRPWYTWCGGNFAVWDYAWDRHPVAGETISVHLCVQSNTGVTTPVTQITAISKGLFSYSFQEKAIVTPYSPSCFNFSFPVPLNAPEDLLIDFEFAGYKSQGLVGCIQTLVTVKAH